MDESPSLRVAPVDASLRAAVLGLRVRAGQEAFAGTVAVSLPDAEQCPGSTPMAILRGDAPIGYYRLEHDARSVAARDYGVPALGLRSFFLDQGWQGRGLALPALAAACADLPGRHPQARLLVLAVHRQNLAAVALYLRGGFVDSGALYHGGRAGPQRLLWRALP
jgi:RimJ/RimL family protein N-acetyltransferase